MIMKQLLLSLFAGALTWSCASTAPATSPLGISRDLPITINEKGPTESEYKLDLPGNVVLNNTSFQELDMTFELHIPVARMRSQLGVPLGRMKEEEVIREFMQAYKDELGLIELDCSGLPECLATVKVETATAEAPGRKILGGLLFQLSQDAVVPFYIYKQVGGDWEQIQGGKLVIAGRVDRVAAAQISTGLDADDFLIPLNETGIADFRYTNPRNPLFIFGKQELPSGTGALALLAKELEEPGKALTSAAQDSSSSAVVQEEQDWARQIQDLHARAGDIPERDRRRLSKQAAESIASILAEKGRLKEQDKISEAQLAITEIRAFVENAVRMAVQMQNENWSSLIPAVVDGTIRSIQQKKEDFFVETLGTNDLGTSLDQQLRERKIRFENRTSDRYFSVSFPLDLPLAECPRKNPSTGKSIEDVINRTFQNGACSGSITVSPGTTVDLDARVVNQSPNKIFQFTADFFDQTEASASFTRGFLALQDIDPSKVELQPKDRFDVGFAASLTGLTDPCINCSLDRVPPAGEVPPFFDGERKRHYTGRGRLDVGMALGNRFNGKLGILFKNSDLGEDLKESKLSLDQYQVTVNGTNALTLTYGNTPFAVPSKGIAIREVGEGFRLGWTGRKIAAQLTHLVKRESELFKADRRDEDKDSWVFHIQPIPLNLGVFYSASVTGVRGQERLDRDERTQDDGKKLLEVRPFVYETYGGELFFAGEQRSYLGSLAGYYSERDSKSRLLPDGRGYVGLLTFGIPYSWITERVTANGQMVELRKKPRRNFTVFLGYGSGDDPKSATDESYIGETGSFLGNVLFFGGLNEFKPQQIGRGLSNKRYGAVQWTDNTFSLQGFIAKLMDVDERDIVSQSTTVRLHEYRFNKKVVADGFGADRDAGREIDLEFIMEGPKSVKWTIQGSYFMPGRAMKDLFNHEDAWSFTAGVSVDPFGK